MRNFIGVDDDNLLSHRSFRNHFEYYDKRVEEWSDGNDSAAYSDSRIDPIEGGLSNVSRLFHSSYNPVSQVLSFREESIDSGALLAELATIREKCRHLVLQ